MPNARPGPALAETRAPNAPGSASPARRRRRRGVAVLVAVAIVASGAWFAGRFLYSSVITPQCTITAAGTTETFDPEQTGNAALIAAISMKRNMAPRAATIALTTAYQESKIRNLIYGDRDSVGLFQQRPSMGWGTEKQILDPVFATNRFYDALAKYADYEHADITKIAQKVQKSGYPEAYREHEGQGRVLASTLTGHSPAGLTCRLDPAKSSVSPQRVAADLAQQMGVTARTGDGSLTITAPDQTTAWAVAHWAVARAEQYGATAVSIGERQWDRNHGDDGWSNGQASTKVTITLA
jgi:hypothetical protein